jgi:hypothetical protein
VTRRKIPLVTRSVRGDVPRKTILVFAMPNREKTAEVRMRINLSSCLKSTVPSPANRMMTVASLVPTARGAMTMMTAARAPANMRDVMTAEMTAEMIDEMIDEMTGGTRSEMKTTTDSGSSPRSILVGTTMNPSSQIERRKKPSAREPRRSGTRKTLRMANLLDDQSLLVASPLLAPTEAIFPALRPMIGDLPGMTAERTMTAAVAMRTPGDQLAIRTRQILACPARAS